jgi:hypothetical protein
VALTNTFGKKVEPTLESIKRSLLRPDEVGWAHVLAVWPELISISRWKESKKWKLSVEECSPRTLKTIYIVDFTDADIDETIEFFLALLKSPRKDFIKAMRERLGLFIFPQDNVLR